MTKKLEKSYSQVGKMLYAEGEFCWDLFFGGIFFAALNTAGDFRNRLRFPRGGAGASSGFALWGLQPTAISRRSLRLLLQSTAR